MKLLAFAVPGNTIKTPDQVAPIMNALQPLGSNVWKNAIGILFVVAILMTFVYFFYGGWLWMNSEGDKKKVGQARDTLVYAAIGLTIVFLSFLIVNVFGAFFNVPLLHNTLY